MMQKLFQRYREQQQSLESHASTRIKDALKEIQKEEEFGDEEEEDVLEAILLDHVAFRTFKGLHHDGDEKHHQFVNCLLYTSPSPRDVEESRMPSSA